MAFYPTKGSIGSGATTDGLANGNYWTKNYVMDRPIIEIWNASAGAATLAADMVGTATIGECNSSLAAAIEMDTTETMGFQFRLPYDMDINKDIDIRVIWSADEAAAAGQTANHVLLYKHVILGTTAVAVPATAFDTNAGAQLSHGANILGAGGWNTIVASKMTTFIPGESRLYISCTTALVTLTKPFIAAYELRYWRRFI